MEDTHFVSRDVQRNDDGTHRIDVWTSNSGIRYEFIVQDNEWIIYNHPEDKSYQADTAEARQVESKLRVWAMNYINKNK